MGACGRASIILGETVTVDVVTNFQNVEALTNQCLVNDNPGRVTIHVNGSPEDGTSDIVIVVDGEQAFPFGFLARVVDALDKAKGQPATYQNARAYWR